MQTKGNVPAYDSAYRYAVTVRAHNRKWFVYANRKTGANGDKWLNLKIVLDGSINGRANYWVSAVLDGRFRPELSPGMRAMAEDMPDLRLAVLAYINEKLERTK